MSAMMQRSKQHLYSIGSSSAEVESCSGRCTYRSTAMISVPEINTATDTVMRRKIEILQGPSSRSRPPKSNLPGKIRSAVFNQFQIPHLAVRT
jgi:hypothetical protein